MISPLLANLFLHYALDEWLRRNYPEVPFERYADDMIVHCKTQGQAQALRVAIEARLGECRLELHPQKTRIVYCKDSNRQGGDPDVEFDFLGFTFRPRKARNRRGQYFTSFAPAISRKAVEKIHQVMKQWAVHRSSDKSLEELSGMYNPALRGWVNYYGRFYRSALYEVFAPLQGALVRWAMRKYSKLRGRTGRSWDWLKGVVRRQPRLFAHWQLSPEG